MPVSHCRRNLAAMTAVIDYFNSLEGDLCVRVNRLSERLWVRRVFVAVSKLGDGWFWGALAIVPLVLHRPQAGPTVLVMTATAVAGIGIYKLLKHKLVRERPYINHRGILCGAAPLDRYSFPSGHTMHAASFTIMFYQLDPLFLAVALPFAILVAASRIILGLHYPSDVVVGAALGVALGASGSGLL
jgi:undecaprenyl-diphosphatase